MKNLTIFTVLLLFCSLSFGQNTFRGKLIDATTKRAVSDANIILLALPDSTLVKGAISNDEGVFELINTSKHSNLALKILHLEYKTQVIPVKETDFVGARGTRSAWSASRRPGAGPATACPRPSGAPTSSSPCSPTAPSCATSSTSPAAWRRPCPPAPCSST